MKQGMVILVFVLLVSTVQAKGIREDIEFTGEKSRTGYAFGMVLGNDLRQAGLELDYYAFTEGLKAVMEGGQTVMDNDEARELVQNAFENAMAKRSEELRIREELFLAENAARSSVTTTESGLQYEVLAEGSGPKPVESDTVKVHYEGTLIDGTVFDSSYRREEPEEIPLYEVIPGWAEGIMLMNVGSKYRLVIPSSIAYGEAGAGDIIPPYSSLVFTVELLDIVPESSDEADAETETEAETGTEAAD